MPKPAAPFQPSDAQRRFVHHIYQNQGMGTVESMCESAKIPRATYYRWCKNDGFRLWFATAWSARFILDGTTLLNTARLHAWHSYSLWKALFDLTFTPQGLAQLHHWQETCAAVGSDAFDLPDLEPEPDAQVSHPPAPQPPQNQHPGAGSETKPPRLPEYLPLTHRVYRGPDGAAGSRALPHHLPRLLARVRRAETRARRGRAASGGGRA